MTVKDSYPIPRIDEALDRLSKCKYFTKLDIARGFWQLPIQEEDKEKTAFTTNGRLYEFETMPFGLANAPRSFQRMILKHNSDPILKKR